MQGRFFCGRMKDIRIFLYQIDIWTRYQKEADEYIAQYPGIKLQEFIANTVTQFTK